MKSALLKKAGGKRRDQAGPGVKPPSPPDYQSLVEAAGDLIYTLDLQGRFTFVNSAVKQVMGYTPDEVLGKSFTDYLTAESARNAVRHFSQGLTGTENTPFFEVEAHRKLGGTAYLEIRAGSLMHDGVMVGRQGIARDISELKALQTQIAEKSQRVALLEERTHIAMNLYSRIAGLASESADDSVASGETLRQVQDAVLRASAGKIGLTVTDLKIIELLSLGHSNREIADLVCRSPHTVKDHVAKIMQRLGAKRRAEVVASALKLGLLSSAQQNRSP